LIDKSRWKRGNQQAEDQLSLRMRRHFENFQPVRLCVFERSDGRFAPLIDCVVTLALSWMTKIISFEMIYFAVDVNTDQ
jgi:hypothetical protein